MEASTAISHKNPVQYERNFAENILSEDGLAVSEELYWEKYYEHPDVRYEWVNGYLEEVSVSDFMNIMMYQWFIQILGHYLQVYPVGKMVIPDFGFRLALPYKTGIRKPDLAVVMNDNPVSIRSEDHFYRGVFDLCVEVVSDLKIKDVHRDTVVKKIEYENIGVREYYILDAKGRMAFYARNRQGKYETVKPAEDTIIRSSVLPDFGFRISDFYRQPSLADMAEDEVYKDYIFPMYQVQKMRAENAEKRAEDAEKRAEILAEKLRGMGVVV